MMGSSFTGKLSHILHFSVARSVDLEICFRSIRQTIRVSRMSVIILHIICSEGETTSVELNQFAICVVVTFLLLLCSHICLSQTREGNHASSQKTCCNSQHSLLFEILLCLLETEQFKQFDAAVRGSTNNGICSLFACRSCYLF